MKSTKKKRICNTTMIPSSICLLPVKSRCTCKVQYWSTKTVMKAIALSAEHNGARCSRMHKTNEILYFSHAKRKMSDRFLTTFWNTKCVRCTWDEKQFVLWMLTTACCTTFAGWTNNWLPNCVCRYCDAICELFAVLWRSDISQEVSVCETYIREICSSSFHLAP